MSQQLDAQGEAHQALGTAVASYGPRVLSDPHTLGNLVADLLPDLPRERSLLVTGAEADVAAEMRQHVEDQHIDPDTAVQLVARTLSERRAIDPAAGLWVAAEYAQALGYQVQPRTPAVPSGPPPASPAAPAANAMPPAAQVPAQPSWPQAGQVPAQPSWPPAGQAAQSPQSWPPDGRRPEGVSPAGQMPQRPPGQFWQPSLPQQPWTPPGSAAQSWPPAGAPPQSWPLAGPPPGQSWPPVQSSSGTPKSSWTGRKLGLIAGGTVIALLGGYLIAAVFVHTVPFAKAKARPAAVSSALHSVRPAAKPTQPATPAPTGPVAAAGVAPLMQLLPGDIDDPATQCQNDPPPYDWDMTGRVAAMICSDPGLPKGTEVHAYQLDSQAHFEATWQSFNKVIGFNSADAGGDCPPAKGGEGTAPMHSKWFPPRAGQVFECLTVQDTNGKPQPLITWTFPTEDTYIVVVGPDSSSFAPLLAWFTSASMPLASPSPAAS
jgi:hypothetical protein